MLRLVVRGYGDDAKLGHGALEHGRELEAVDVRHADVKERDVRFLRRNHRQPLPRIGDHADTMPKRAQGGSGGFRHIGVVVDDDHSAFYGASEALNRRGLRTQCVGEAGIRGDAVVLENTVVIAGPELARVKLAYV